MTRHLRIERESFNGEPRPITLREWKEAVGCVEGVRMSEGDASLVNPLTKEPVVLPNRGGDADLFRADCNRWLRALWWTPDGIVRFAAPEADGDTILATAQALAGELEARIVGQDGEVYD